MRIVSCPPRHPNKIIQVIIDAETKAGDEANRHRQFTRRIEFKAISNRVPIITADP